MMGGSGEGIYTERGLHEDGVEGKMFDVKVSGEG